MNTMTENEKRERESFARHLHSKAISFETKDDVDSIKFDYKTARSIIINKSSDNSVRDKEGKIGKKVGNPYRAFFLNKNEDEAKRVRSKSAFVNSKLDKIKFIKTKRALHQHSRSVFTFDDYDLIPLHKGYGSALRVNKKHKPSMEDFVRLIDNFHITELKRDVALFILCDGHAGDDVAKIVIERFPEILYSILFDKNTMDKRNDKMFIENSIHSAFKLMDEELEGFEEEGTTLNVILMTYEDGKRIVYSANVGDSGNVLISEKHARKISYDHKSTDKKEIERVKNAGGVFLKKRFYGAMAITRALGDYTFKLEGSGLISDPTIEKIEIKPEDLYIIMGSDGVFDVINEDKALTIIMRESNDKANFIKNPYNVAKVFVETSLELGSKDNISCIAIRLN